MIKVKEIILERIQKQEKLPTRNYLNWAVTLFSALVLSGPKAALVESRCLTLKTLFCVWFWWMSYRTGV